jgi:signal transduction histidine kinase
MTELTAITLENEMDLTLAYKKSIRTADLLGLTISTQTAFATAVSEICREVIDKGFDGVAKLGTLTDDGRFFLVAKITCRIDEFFSRGSDGLEYARKLLPVLDVVAVGDTLIITAKLSIPRSARVDQKKVREVKKQLLEEGPISAYEEIKQRNAELNLINQQHELALTHAAYLDQKKNDFLSLASHELNSPLTILRSYSQLALRVNNRDNSLHKFLTKIDTQTAKLASMVRQLMDFSRIEHDNVIYQQDTVNLRVYLEDILEPLQLLVPSHSLSMDAGPDSNVMIDALRIEQVVSNLVSNAAKYSEPGSAIQIVTNSDDDFVHVSVTDKGIGMDEQTTHRIFDKFYRSALAEKKYSGLGMGLFVAWRIVKDHGGVLSVSSQVDEGSVFSFSLPLMPAANVEAMA